MNKNYNRIITHNNNASNNITDSQLSFSINNVIDSIPKDAISNPNFELLNQGFVEWKWKFLLINKKNIVEISQFDPKINKRMYLNKSGNWMECTASSLLNGYYDKYIIKEFYYYTN